MNLQKKQSRNLISSSLPIPEEHYCHKCGVTAGFGENVSVRQPRTDERWWCRAHVPYLPPPLHIEW
jgi:hypothetical protein